MTRRSRSLPTTPGTGHRDGRVGLDEAQRQCLVGMVVGAHATGTGRVLGDGVAVPHDIAIVAVIDEVAFGVRVGLSRARGESPKSACVRSRRILSLKRSNG